MTTLLTGASGFIGSWIARTLAADRLPGRASPALRVLARRTSDLSMLQGLPVEVVAGDLLDPVSLQRALEGVSTVYHAAGLISFLPRDAELVRRVNAEGAVNLFEAARRAGVERVVYTASIFALGSARDPEHPAAEDSPFNAEDLLDIPYVRAKRDAELAACEAIARGLPLIRLYPGLCLGPEDRNRSSSGAIDQWLRGRLPAIVGGGGICVIDVRDAAAAHVAAMQRGVPGRRYLAAGHNVTLVELFRRLEPIAGRRAPRLRVSVGLGVLFARLAERLSPTPLFDSSQARLMARYWWYESRRAGEELGVSFRPLDETLVATVAWLRRQARGQQPS